MIQVLRGLVAIAIVVAIVGQALANADRGTFNPANFFSYFTILSNIASVWLLGRMALQPSWAKSNAVVRGAITLYMAVTGIVDALLLSGVDVGLPGALGRHDPARRCSRVCRTRLVRLPGEATP
jgi:hypothetical protein